MYSRSVLSIFDILVIERQFIGDIVDFDQEIRTEMELSQIDTPKINYQRRFLKQSLQVLTRNEGVRIRSSNYDQSIFNRTDH